jgi:transposase
MDGMAEVTIELDLPEGVELCGYERHEEGHAFEVRWRWPERCACESCGHEEAARITLKDTVYVVRDLEVWGQPSFWVYQPPFHACSRCGHRQHLPPPFRRKDVSYTYRFEEAVLRSLIGSTEEDAARRWGISAETAALIVRNQLGEWGAVDPQWKITDVGVDEISLKKRHKQYVTILTDLTDPERPRVLAVAEGRDQAAAEACLNRLSPAQRQRVRTHRTDMSPAYAAACGKLLPGSQQVIDRFHVARLLGEAAETVRKKRPARTKRRFPKRRRRTSRP